MKIQLKKNVLPNLKKIRKIENGWMACCPAHEDTTSSLFVNENDGSVLLECQTGCSYVQIVQALGKIEHEQNKIIESAEIIKENLDKKVSDNQEYREDISFTSQGAFVVKSANQWIEGAKNKPVPKMILGELWYEGEICILFADTNVGKSILAVQIADSLTKIEEVEPFITKADNSKVLYFDFELTEQQFIRRYSEQEDNEYTNIYEFSEDFLRVEINRNYNVPENFKTFEEYLVTNIEREIANSGVEIIIIDNLSCIKSDNESAKDAAPFMQQLKAIKDKYKVSILVLAHTPKRDNSKPLDLNDLAGSKMLSNYADSIVAIGKSQLNKDFRYIKQLKARSSEIVYDSENVCIFEIIKKSNFLKFKFEKFDNESNHLYALTQKSRELKIAEAKKLNSQNKTQREIAKEMGIALGTVSNYLKEPVQFYDTNKMNIVNNCELIDVNE